MDNIEIEMYFTGGGLFDGGSKMQIFEDKDNIWTVIDVYDEINKTVVGRYTLINIERTGNGDIATYKYKHRRKDG